MKKYEMKTNYLIALIYASAIFGIIPCLLVSGFALIHQQNKEAKLPVIIALSAIIGVFLFINVLILPICKYTDSVNSLQNGVDIVFWVSLLQTIALAILAFIGLMSKEKNIEE